MNWDASPLAITGIGSLPTMELPNALDQVFTLNIPYLPTFPQRGSGESFLGQLGLSEEGSERAFRLPLALEAWRDRAIAEKPAAIKMQWPGPLSLYQALLAKGHEDKFPKFFDEWKNNLGHLLQSISNFSSQSWFFFDEPGLGQFLGHSHFSPGPWTAFKAGIDWVESTGALVGLHCCGEIPWPHISELPVTLLSFDWYLESKKILARWEEIHNWFERGRALVLGVVPTQLPADWDEGKVVSEVLEVFTGIFGANRVKDRLKRCWLSPACGLGMGSVEEMTAIGTALHHIQEQLRRSLHLK